MNKNLTRWLLGMLLCMQGSVAWALTQAGGVYQIGTAQDLADFAALVNGGARTACAVLTADIDYTGQTAMIGTSASSFLGTLDGQGHTVTVNLTGSANGTALVAYHSGVVRNLHVTGTITSAFKHAAGVAAYSYGGAVLDCWTDVTINSGVSGDATCAGIVGQADYSTSVIGCVFSGKISGKAAANCAGIVGWMSNTTTVRNCLAIGEMDIVMNASTSAIGRNSASANAVVENCYALDGFKGTVDAGVTLLKQDQIEGGEAAFRLGMGQRLGTDKCPSPLSGSKVYASAPTCSGQGATAYTNDKAQAQIPAHTYDGFRCSECGAINKEFLTPVGGVYEVATAEQLDWVAAMVADGHLMMDVRLTSDIDMGNYPEWAMIGRVKCPYRGHFDGQHHKISNLKINYPKGVGVGLFGTISGGALVENLTLDESCSILGLQHVGLVGHSQGASYIILRGLGNQGSVAAVAASQGGSGDAGVGGIIGNSPHGGRGEISNCWFTGTIPSGTSCAFISGWAGSNQFTLNGCWAICDTYTGVSETNNLARAGASGTAVTLKNCASNYGKQGTLVTREDAASGALCFTVNGQSTDAPAWRQTLGTDPLPTLTGKDIVYMVGTKNCDGTTAEDFAYSNENKGFVQKPHTIDPATGLCSTCGQPERAEDNFYLISAAPALRWVASQVNSGAAERLDFRLTQDIDLEGEPWTPIGNDTHPYVGEMDGARHTISHMTVEVQDVAGLFGTATAANLHDLLIDATCSVKGSRYSGGLIGHTTGSFTTNITNVGTMCPVTCEGSGNNAAAGIIGNANAYNVTNITGCFSTGRIESAGDVACISAWQGNVGSKVTNCWSISEIAQHTSYNFCRGGATTTITGCYCANDYTGGLKANYNGTISADMLATGELCYVVNGSSSESPVWYQTLGTDATPLPWNDHKVVYAVGQLRCDGTSAGGELTYSNENTSTIPPHLWEDGICRECGNTNKDYKQPVGGFYQLATAGDVAWFARMVNTVDNTLNGCLTDDIDFSEANDKFDQIGLKVGYAGTFDGNNHRVSNLTIDVDHDDAGFISASNSGMVLRNIIFDATCSFKTSASWAGVVGTSNWDQTGTTTLINVGNEGSVSVGGVNAGGLLGGNHGSKGIIIMRNCYTTGQVGGQGKGENAALAGWLGGASGSTIENCWTTAEVTGMDGTKEAYRGTAAVKNCFSVQGGQFTQFDKAEASTGALAWKLNGKSFIGVQWYQTIGEDEQPTWMEHGLVYESGEGTYDDVHDQASYEQFRDHTVTSETHRMSETVADQALLTAYATTLEGMGDLATLDDFLKAYASEAEARAAIQASVTLYQTYKALAEYALDYLNTNTFHSVAADRLKEYLTDDSEPSEEFPNGTYTHIMDTHLLNDSTITAETEFVRSMLSAAITADYKPGTEITDLMANATMEAGREGWDITSTNDNYPRILTEPGVMTTAEGWNCNFSMTQTVKGLKAGVYMLESNATFRPGADGYSKFYAAQVILGKNINYAMGEIEDAIDKTLAEDGKNCHITGSAPDYTVVTDNGEAWIPQGPIGCAYAFKAGRYPNLVAVQVEEGDSLVIGVQNQGTGMERDWMGFGNFHLTYLGTPAEGATQLASVLQNYLERAHVIDDFAWSDGVDFAQYPNYQERIKEDLQAAIAQAEKATEGDDMMQAINRLSDLFKQVYECRITYIAMAKSAEILSIMASNFQSQGVFAEDAPELEYMNGVSDQMWTYYTMGTPNALEAYNLAASIFTLPVFPKMQGGYYLLDKPQDLKVFSGMVNSGMSTLRAKLVADIDMAGETGFQPIGFNTETANSSDAEANKVTFNGTFDGQLHRISNLTIERESSIGVGLFGTIMAPAEIKNLILDATCSIKGYDRVGIIGRSTGTGEVKLDCLGNEGSVEAVYQAPAGILGNANAGSLANITNCYSTGSIKAGNGKNAAQICGWLGSMGAHITNCWSTADIEGYDAQDKLFCRYGGNTLLVNCYSTSGDGSQATKLAAEDFASGRVTWLLNGESSEQPVWFQKLGEDLHPVLDSSRGVVVKKDGGYANESGDAVQDVAATVGQTVSVYDVQGRLVRAAGPASQALQGLPRGMYILRGTSASRKVMVK